MSFITKCRPATFKEVIGQAAVVRSLQDVIKRGSSKTFLFTGPSGTGKTTLARILARESGCRPEDLMELDVANQTGIEDMRNVVETLRYKPLGSGAMKALICNEAQMLSKQAWNSLLMELEEPKPWVLWILCTTEPSRIPKAIHTRCTTYDLKPVSEDDLADLLDLVAKKEKLDVEDDVLLLCAREAEGSPRQALVNLAACAAAASLDEAKELLRSALESEEAVNLARALVKGTTWSQAQKIIAGLQEVNPETVRHVVRAYVSKVIIGAKSEASAGRGLEILDAFSTPFPTSDGISPLLLATARALRMG